MVEVDISVSDQVFNEARRGELFRPIGETDTRWTRKVARYTNHPDYHYYSEPISKYSIDGADITIIELDRDFDLTIHTPACMGKGLHHNRKIFDRDGSTMIDDKDLWVYGEIYHQSKYQYHTSF